MLIIFTISRLIILNEHDQKCRQNNITGFSVKDILLRTSDIWTPDIFIFVVSNLYGILKICSSFETHCLSLNDILTMILHKHFVLVRSVEYIIQFIHNVSVKSLDQALQIKSIYPAYKACYRNKNDR